MRSVSTIFLLLFSLSVFAQNLNVTPAKINFNLEPGESYETELVIKNTAKTKQKININLGDFTLDADGQSSFSDANSSDLSCAGWISISQTFLELNPNETKKVKVTMKVPANGTTTRWGMLFIEPAEEQVNVASADKSLSVGTKVSARVGVPVFQSPRKSGTMKADIKNLKEVTTDNGREFVAEVLNQGEKIIEGELFTVFSNVQTGEEVEAPVETLTVLPKGTRNFRFSLPKGLPKGQYVLTIVLDYDDDADQEGVKLNVTVK